jgi:predicted Zn-dependent protease
MIDAARKVMAASASRDTVEFHLVQAQIALDAKDLDAARAAATAALAAAPRDPRAFVMNAEVEIRENKREEALTTLTRGLEAEPTDIDLNQRQLDLLMQTGRWRATDEALDHLRRALAENGAPMRSANLAAARIFEHRGQFYRAVTEYQSAVAQEPDDLGLRLSLAHAAELAGKVTVAVDAYAAVLRRSPNQPEAAAGLARIQSQKKALEVSKVFLSPIETEDKR